MNGQSYMPRGIQTWSPICWEVSPLRVQRSRSRGKHFTTIVGTSVCATGAHNPRMKDQWKFEFDVQVSYNMHNSWCCLEVKRWKVKVTKFRHEMHYNWQANGSSWQLLRSLNFVEILSKLMSTCKELKRSRSRDKYRLQYHNNLI